MAKKEPVADATEPEVAGPVLGTPPPAMSPAATCREIERMQGREPGDSVRCAHLFGDYYRCNWWSRIDTTRKSADYDWSALLTDHIRRSGFFKAKVIDGRLMVEEVPEKLSCRDFT